jgi:hypothetical protein
MCGRVMIHEVARLVKEIHDDPEAGKLSERCNKSLADMGSC